MPELSAIDVNVAISSLIWLINPVFGIFVHPCIGVASDRCNSRLGKRIPFLILFSVSCVFGMMIVATATNIQAAIFPSATSYTCAAILIFCFYGLLDLSLDVLVTPARALLFDTVPKRQVSLLVWQCVQPIDIACRLHQLYLHILRWVLWGDAWAF